MTIEEQLKTYILNRYSSLREFTQIINLPYSTMTTILKRGLANATVQNINKICKELHISADELAAGRITPTTTVISTVTTLESILNLAKQKMLTGQVTLSGKVLTDDQIETITSALDLILELEKRKQ